MKRKIKAKIVRTVTEIAIVIVDRHGEIVEFLETCDELEVDDLEIVSEIAVISEF